jgi:hypothetical protein
MSTTISVRQWFRLARAVQFDAPWRECQIIFRAPDVVWRPPYSRTIPLYNFHDYDKLITAVLAGDLSMLETVEIRVRTRMDKYMRGITE